MGSELREIKWYETYALGFPEIDADHKLLLDTINEMIRAIRSEDRAACEASSRRFVETLRQHFPKEEAFLTEIGYEEIETHAMHHRQMLERAERFSEVCREAESTAALEASITELITHWMKDVRGGDLTFRTHLRDKGLDKDYRSHR